MFIILSLFVLIIVFGFIAVKTDNCRYDDISVLTFILSLFCLIAFIGCSFYVSIEFLANKDAETVSYQQQYESLTYQLENIDTLYANSRANDKKELYNQIQEWNQTVAAGRVRHNNLWINWFYPVNFNEFDFIELK